MRTSAPLAQLIVVGLIAPLAAQNLKSSFRPGEASLKGPGSELSPHPPVASMAPVLRLTKANGDAQEQSPVFMAQDVANLESRLPGRRDLAAVVDLDLLREPSPFRRLAVSSSAGAPDDAVDGLKSGLALISAVYRESGKTELVADCPGISLAVEQRTKLDPSEVLEFVEAEIAANPSCACEIVKAAIKSSDADIEQVVSIVEVTANAAPETLRIAAQCAIAAVPESLAGVQALLARIEPNGGESGTSAKSAKSSKSAKAAEVTAGPDVAAMANPLDFPGTGPVAPGTAISIYQPLLPVTPPVVITPPVTPVDP